MRLHDLELIGGELSWFVQDELRNCQLAHVMEQSRCLDRFQLPFVRNAQSFRKFDCKLLDAANVPMRNLVFGVNRHR